MLVNLHRRLGYLKGFHRILHEYINGRNMKPCGKYTFIRYEIPYTYVIMGQ